MSESLRKTLGFDFDFDKFGSDDDNEGAGADLAAGSGGAAPAPGPTPLSSPEDEDRFDSMGDSADHVLAQYMEMARTPPRTSRREKEKKSYRHQAQAANKTLKASLKRRSSLDKFMSLPAFAENPEEAGSDSVDSAKQGQQRRRGRLLQLERRAERLQKQRAGGDLTFVVGGPVPEADAEERCASLKVETSSCFHSLSSKPVSQMCSPSPSPLRRRRHRPHSGDASPLSPSEEASSPVSDRSEFHQWLSALVRLGSSERPDTRKRSREELRYQTELQDVLWLALQAYHAGESMQQVDQVLCSQRSQLPQLADDLLSFRFQPEPGAAADCPAGGRRCLDVWCRPCLAAQRQALQQAAALMARMDAAERLYPSGQRLLQQQPVFRSAEFRRRLKTLYLWHNLTSQLWMRMRIIRQYLKGMGAGQLPWPELAPEAELCLSPSSSNTQPNVAAEEVPPVTPQDRPPPRVQFTDLAPSSNPSDSSSSNTSDSAATDKLTPRSRGHSYHWSVSTASGTSEADTEADDKTPYRKCVEKLLKTKGLKRTLSKLINHLKSILDQTHMALLPPDHQREGSPTGEVYSSGDGSSLGLDDRTALELRQFGELSDTSRDMNLPSFKPVYTWLSLVPLELTHECVRIRLQQQPQEPSALSIRQLIAECKEALRAAVTVRQRFIRRLRVLRPPATTPGAGPPPTARLDATLESFDADVREMLEVYLRYIKRLLLLMQWEIEVSAAQKSLLEEEWAFAKGICPHIAGGEAVAGRNFCFLVSDILPTIGDLLENGIDTCIASLQRSSSVPSGREPQRNRSSTLTTLREFRVLFLEARDRAQKALLFARLLRRDLELAAAFRLSSSPEGVLRRLADTGHVRVLAPHSHQHVIFIPGALQADRAQVWRLLDMTLSRQEPRGAAPGYLVLLACHDCGDVDALWRGTTIRLEPTAETTITLSYVEVKGLLLVVNNAGVLARARQPFQRAMGACLSLEREETPPNRAITDALEELKEEALKLRQVVANSVALVEEKCSAMLSDPTGTSLAARCREVVQQCFKFAFEYHRELGRLVTGARRAELAPAMLDVASHWLRYVLEYCPSGCGLRPRWAREGLEFVNYATEPPHTRHMEETAFKLLQEQVKRCVRHLQAAISPLAGAGSRPSSPCDLSRPPYRASRSLPPPGESPRPRPGAPGAAEQATPPSPRRDSLRRDSSDRGLSDLASPVGSRSEGLDLSAGSVSPARLSLDALPVPPLERARRAVAELDARRDERLHELRRIGHLSERRADRVHIKAKTVGFTWQMGFLIGQGRFGRVYTAVNNSTGELMAVKEIQLQPNDHRTLRAAAEELQLLEGVHHQHLVRYYGVEIHREEMFIFMEFCGEGTLETLSASAEGGLPEHLIRHYTKQLLSAVSCLHAHHIVHRDIKGANVFLTDECRCLKLGDFGCSVKIVAHTTMQGEVKGLVGTPAFMAPEVYTRSGSEGQGRAADVWSLGCCVVEMATGKRPFPELDDTYQIMFRVGMGGSPALPDKLSQEGHQFLQLCFQHEPKKRALAHQLEDHPFVKVGSDPDEVLSSLPQSLMSGFTRMALS